MPATTICTLHINSKDDLEHKQLYISGKGIFGKIHKQNLGKCGRNSSTTENTERFCAIKLIKPIMCYIQIDIQSLKVIMIINPVKTSCSSLKAENGPNQLMKSYSIRKCF